jgi:SNF2 family DNA or RNA helicase
MDITIKNFDWNQQLQQKHGIDVVPLLLANEPNFADLPKFRVVSIPVNSKIRIHSRSWFFDEIQQKESAEPDETANETSPPPEIAVENKDPDDSETLLIKSDPDQLTRIKVPRDAIKIQDRLGYILQPPIESILNLPSLELPFEPFAYQRQGVAFLYSAQFAILADEMGLGKTMQAITTIRILLRTGEIRSVLLVCPKPLIPNWQREFKTWSPEINVQVIDGPPARRKWLWQLPHVPVRIANYELLNRDREYFDPAYFDMSLAKNVPSFDLVVLDESQRIKSSGNATSLAAKAITRKRNWALTGTPVENSQEDLVGIFDFLSPGLLESGLPPQKICDVVGEHILRRTKDMVKIEIPPKLIRDAMLDLTPQQAETYRMAEDDGVLRLTEAGDGIEIMQVLELVMRLKQICNFDPATGESAKLERLTADLEEVAESGRKAIIFSQWVETLLRLKAELGHFGIAEYHGKIPQKQREDMIELFRNDKNCHVILMSYGAGSVGLNLQFAEYVFLFDRWWNPAIEDQAINRAHRIGAAGPITVTRFISTDTVEERIDRVLQEKRALSELILSGAQGLNCSSGLNQDELFGLFNLRAPQKSKKAA